ncbi:helix-turn-helix domain-containing protein [Moraxella pluranimalium]|uniref:helix-turn-helix domain-containing protein n=1 Tax=Moraxella pluranimalium TaxID=470453 RepID=UPI000993886D|nr:helix-turn-helix domain-containing protein [Moraxella pluranimalium]
MNYDPKGHKAEILKILMAGQTLTRKDAVQLFDCYNLSQRVGELIRMGYPIKM